MSYIKAPSWLELVKHGIAPFTLELLKPLKRQHEQSFWKERCLRFGFDIRDSVQIQCSWQNLFYEKFFQYTLKRIDNNIQSLKASEKKFWKKKGRYIEHLELTAINQQDLELMLQWFPNVGHIVLKKCNTLLQANTQVLTGLTRLRTLEIHDTHLLTEKAFANIPSTIRKLVINDTKCITNEFFDQLLGRKHLVHLSLENCSGLQLNQLAKLPPNLLELDLSGSGKAIIPDACFCLPRSLTLLKMNRWDHFGDAELALLPRNLHTLELEGWQITAGGLQKLKEMPISCLNLSKTACSDIEYLPRTLKKLTLLKNCLTAKQLAPLAQMYALEELDLSYTPMDDAEVQFPKSLKSLNLCCCGHIHKDTIRLFKTLKNLKKLFISSCMLENSDLEWLPEGVEELDISQSTKITDVGLILLGTLAHLSSLCLDGCEQIRGFGLSRLAPTLKKLSLAGLHRLSGKSLVQLPEALEELSLDSCELVMLEDIQTLPLTLQVLSLDCCIHIGNEACDFISSLPLLNTISLQGCPRITEVAIAKLVRRKFEGTIIIKSDIELHPPVSALRKLTNFKARLIHKLKSITDEKLLTIYPWGYSLNKHSCSIR